MTTAPEFEFGPFRIDAPGQRLLRDGEPVPLTPKAFDLLLFLVEHRDRVMSKDELVAHVWAGVSVTDASLTQTVFTLRKALGAEGERWIETVPRRGYRFSGAVRVAPSSGAPHAGRPVSPRVLWTAVGLATLFVTSAAWMWTRSNDPPQRLTLSIAAPPGTVMPPRRWSGPPVVSPDGRRLAFVAAEPQGQPMLWIRRLETDDGAALSGTEGAFAPFWSPDSAAVAFFSEGKLRRISVHGGAVTEIADASNGRGGTWSIDDTIVFAPSQTAGLYRVAAGGGSPVQLTSPRQDLGELSHRWPQRLPRGGGLLFYVLGSEQRRGTYLAHDDGSNPRRIVEGSANAIFAPPGHLLFWRDGRLLSASFDVASGQLTDRPQVAADRVFIDPVFGWLKASASANGVLVYQQPFERVHGDSPMWRDRRGGRVSEIAPGPVGFRNPALSRDGQRLAFGWSDSPAGTVGVWTLELLTGASARLTYDASDDVFPVWSPDAASIAYSATTQMGQPMFVKAAEGLTAARLLPFPDAIARGPADWSPDGRFLVFWQVGVGGKGDLFVLDMETPSAGPEPLLAGPADERQARLSPDGQWLAYTSDASGQHEVFITPFRRPGEQRQVSTGGGFMPAWRGDGKELFYIARDRTLTARRLPGGPSGSMDVPLPLFQLDIGLVTMRESALAQYVVSPDGERVLAATTTRLGPAPHAVIWNWAAASGEGITSRR